MLFSRGSAFGTRLTGQLVVSFKKLERQRGRFAPHWELRSLARTRAWALRCLDSRVVAVLDRRVVAVLDSGV